MMNKSESLLVPRHTCMWNAPEVAPRQLARSIRQVGFVGKTLGMFERGSIKGYSIRPVFKVRGRSSIGRAPRLQRGGCRFEPGRLQFMSRWVFGGAGAEYFSDRVAEAVAALGQQLRQLMSTAALFGAFCDVLIR